jgi:hypothetical protein
MGFSNTDSETVEFLPGGEPGMVGTSGPLSLEELDWLRWRALVGGNLSRRHERTRALFT